MLGYRFPTSHLFKFYGIGMEQDVSDRTSKNGSSNYLSTWSERHCPNMRELYIVNVMVRLTCE